MISNSDSCDSIIIILLNGPSRTIKISTVEIPKSSWWDVSCINKAATLDFGIPVRVVRCIFGDNNEIAASKRIYAVEAIGTQCQDGLIGSLDSMDLKLLGSSLNAIMELLDARRNPVYSRLIGSEPWVACDFHQRMQNFICKVINAKTTSITWAQLRCWPRAYIYEIKAEGNRYFFKACPPAYAIEPMLTQYLSKKYSNLTANVEAVEANEFFLLSAAFNGGEVVIGDMKSFAVAAQGLAEIQVAESKEIANLLSLGLVLNDYHTLMNSILALVNDHAALMIGEKSGLTIEELNKFKGAEKLLISAVNRLQTIGVPLSLEHGDFRAANILCNESHTCCIIDWSEAVISHPFFSLAQLLDEEDHGQDSVKNQIASSYFVPWLKEGFTIDHLQEALDLARLLMPIVKAIERRERLIPNLADAKSWKFSVAYWVRRFLLRFPFHDQR